MPHLRHGLPAFLQMPSRVKEKGMTPEGTTIKDWVGAVNQQLEESELKGKNGFQRLIELAEEALEEVAPARTFINAQHERLEALIKVTRQLHQTIYNEAARPPRWESTEPNMLDTPEKRSKAITEAALALTEPGSEISAETVLAYLAERGLRIVAQNQKATIATVLYFNSEFEKVRRGVFRRKLTAVHTQS